MSDYKFQWNPKHNDSSTEFPWHGYFTYQTQFQIGISIECQPAKANRNQVLEISCIMYKQAQFCDVNTEEGDTLVID